MKAPVSLSGLPALPGCRVPALLTLAIVQAPLAVQLAPLATLSALPAPKLAMVLVIEPVPVNAICPAPPPPSMLPFSTEPVASVRLLTPASNCTATPPVPVIVPALVTLAPVPVKMIPVTPPIVPVVLLVSTDPLPSEAPAIALSRIVPALVTVPPASSWTP